MSAATKSHQEKPSSRDNARSRDQPLPRVGRDAFVGIIALQRSLGNRAVDGLLSGAMPASAHLPHADDSRRPPSIAQNPVASAVHAGQDGAGIALEPPVQEAMERAYGTALDDVRIHADSGACRSAEMLGAKAYTTGSDIYFNKNQYQPHSTTGKRLLAHELAHVAQQRMDGSPANSGDAESEAEAASDHAAAGEAFSIRNAAPTGAIQRAPLIDDMSEEKILLELNSLEAELGVEGKSISAQDWQRHNNKRTELLHRLQVLQAAKAKPATPAPTSAPYTSKFQQSATAGSPPQASMANEKHPWIASLKQDSGKEPVVLPAPPVPSLTDLAPNSLALHQAVVSKEPPPTKPPFEFLGGAGEAAWNTALDTASRWAAKPLMPFVGAYAGYQYGTPPERPGDKPGDPGFKSAAIQFGKETVKTTGAAGAALVAGYEAYGKGKSAPEGPSASDVVVAAASELPVAGNVIGLVTEVSKGGEAVSTGKYREAGAHWFGAVLNATSLYMLGRDIQEHFSAKAKAGSIGGKDSGGTGGKDLAGAGGEDLAGTGGKDLAGTGGKDLAGAGGEDLAGTGGKDLAQSGGKGGELAIAEHAKAEAAKDAATTKPGYGQDAAPPKKIPPGMSANEMAEPELIAQHHPNARQLQDKASGFDAVEGGRLASATTIPEKAGKSWLIVTTERVRGGNWIQIKKLGKADFKRMKAEIKIAVTKAKKALLGPRKSRFQRIPGRAADTGWRVTPVDPDKITIHLHIESELASESIVNAAREYLQGLTDLSDLPPVDLLVTGS